LTEFPTGLERNDLLLERSLCESENGKEQSEQQSKTEAIKAHVELRWMVNEAWSKSGGKIRGKAAWLLAESRRVCATVADLKIGHSMRRPRSEATVYCKLRDISARAKKEIAARDGGE
jgi:hypothetical protein